MAVSALPIEIIAQIIYLLPAVDRIKKWEPFNGWIQPQHTSHAAALVCRAWTPLAQRNIVWLYLLEVKNLRKRVQLLESAAAQPTNILWTFPRGFRVTAPKDDDEAELCKRLAALTHEHKIKHNVDIFLPHENPTRSFLNILEHTPSLAPHFRCLGLSNNDTHTTPTLQQEREKHISALLERMQHIEDLRLQGEENITMMFPYSLIIKEINIQLVTTLGLRSVHFPSHQALYSFIAAFPNLHVLWIHHVGIVDESGASDDLPTLAFPKLRHLVTSAESGYRSDKSTGREVICRWLVQSVQAKHPVPLEEVILKVDLATMILPSIGKSLTKLILYMDTRHVNLSSCTALRTLYLYDDTECEQSHTTSSSKAIDTLETVRSDQLERLTLHMVLADIQDMPLLRETLKKPRFAHLFDLHIHTTVLYEIRYQPMRTALKLFAGLRGFRWTVDVH